MLKLSINEQKNVIGGAHYWVYVYDRATNELLHKIKTRSIEGANITKKYYTTDTTYAKKKKCTNWYD